MSKESHEGPPPSTEAVEAYPSHGKLPQHYPPEAFGYDRSVIFTKAKSTTVATVNAGRFNAVSYRQDRRDRWRRLDTGSLAPDQDFIDECYDQMVFLTEPPIAEQLASGVDCLTRLLDVVKPGEVPQKEIDP